jgi:hypothetical protein
VVFYRLAVLPFGPLPFFHIPTTSSSFNSRGRGGWIYHISIYFILEGPALLPHCLREHLMPESWAYKIRGQLARMAAVNPRRADK